MFNADGRAVRMKAAFARLLDSNVVVLWLAAKGVGVVRENEQHVDQRRDVDVRPAVKCHRYSSWSQTPP
jgi:hypothetical protein